MKLEKALSDHDRKDAEYNQLKRELDRTQVNLMNVREDLREAQEKAQKDLLLVDQFWELQMEITNCESYRLGWQERDKPEADRIDPDEADRRRGLTPGVYPLKELVNGVIRDVVDDDDTPQVPADPSSVIIQAELPQVEALPIDRSVVTGGGSGSMSETPVAEIDQTPAPAEAVAIVPPAVDNAPSAPPSSDTPPVTS